MEYKGKLYGKVGEIVFPLLHTTDDWEKMENRIKELEARTKQKKLNKPDVMESVLPLLRECIMRCNLALPETSQDLQWFDETCDIKNSGDFWERIHAALELGGKTAP